MISNAAILAQYQLWRTGVDERTLDEIGLNLANISEAISGVLDELNRAKHRNAELVEALQNMTRLINNRQGGHYLEVFERVEVEEANELLSKIKGETNA